VVAAVWSCAMACGGTDRASTPTADTTGAPSTEAQVGPVCPRCLVGGGESTDFSGGLPLCAQFIRRRVLVSEAEAAAAGLDVAAARYGIERRFESELGWKDLSLSTARTRVPAISGFEPQTLIRGKVSATGYERDYFDATTCIGLKCPVGNGIVEDCSALAFDDRYFLKVQVSLDTDDGAISAVLRGRAAVPDPPHDEMDTRLRSFGAFVDLSEVRGALRVAPPEGSEYGTLSLGLAYYPDAVRGMLTVSFTNWTDALLGSGAMREDDLPLVAKFPIDDCDTGTPPAPLDVPHPKLQGRTPGDLLAELQSAIDDAGPAARWLHTGADTELRLDVERPAYACVNLQGYPQPSSGITNVPVHLGTRDGLLDWSDTVSYRFDDSSGVATHLLSFEQQWPAAAPGDPALRAFAFPTFTHTHFATFRAAYSATAASAAAASLVFRLAASSACAGNDAACNDAYVAAYTEYCLVAPPNGGCAIPR
jgi:hypothetical protein